MNDNLLDLMFKEKGNIMLIICVSAHGGNIFGWFMASASDV